MWEWWDSLESVARFRWWIHVLLWVTPLLFLFIFGGLRILADYRREQLITQRQQELAKPRQLSPQQQEEFLAILRETPSAIVVESPVGDPEAFAFAKELQTLFTDAGWTAGAELGMTIFDPPRYGIEIKADLRIVRQEDQEMATPEISVLERAFNAVGMPPKIDVTHTIQATPWKFITLHVGHKPKPSD
jgi:hypothetical protein